MLLRPAVLIPALMLTTAIAVARDDATSTLDAPIHVATTSASDVQRSACIPAVFRLCRQFIPDVNGIVACLKLQRSNLSPACRTVFH